MNLTNTLIIKVIAYNFKLKKMIRRLENVRKNERNYRRAIECRS